MQGDASNSQSVEVLLEQCPEFIRAYIEETTPARQNFVAHCVSYLDEPDPSSCAGLSDALDTLAITAQTVITRATQAAAEEDRAATLVELVVTEYSTTRHILNMLLGEVIYEDGGAIDKESEERILAALDEDDCDLAAVVADEVRRQKQHTINQLNEVVINLHPKPQNTVLPLIGNLAVLQASIGVLPKASNE